MGNYDPIYEAAGKQYNVDPALLKAVAIQESGENPNRTGAAGEWGMMQFMPATAAQYGLTRQQAYQPQLAIPAAARYLSDNLNRFTDKNGNVNLPAAVAAYNGSGPAAQQYAATVLPIYQRVAAARQQQATQAPAQTASPNQAPLSGKAADPFSAFAQDGQKELDAATSPTPSTPQQAATTQAADPMAGFVQDGMKELEAASAPAQQPAPALDTSKLGPLASDVAAKQLEAERAAAPQFTDAGVRQLLAPAPNTTYASNPLLPIARDDTTGAYRLALPSSLRDLAQGAYELSQGPATGTVTPAGSAALAQIVMGVPRYNSLAAGTGEAIGNRLLAPGSASLGRNETPDLLGSALRADPVAPGATNPLLAKAAGAAPDTAQAAGPQPGMGGPAPNSVGAAATPGNMTNMSPKEAAANQARAENYRLANPRPDGVDKTIYIPGTVPTAAETSGNADIAGRLKYISQDPNLRQTFREAQLNNSRARADYFQETAGDPVNLYNLKQARDAQAQQDLAAAWSNKQPTDPSPIGETVSDILNSPEGKRDAVKNVLQPIIEKLQKADGSGPETDPEMIYGVRKYINDLLDKKNGSDADDAKAASSQLLQVRDATDGVIEHGAPGFGQYLTNYQQLSKPIDSAKLLQEAEPRLLNGADRTITFAKFDNFMKGVVQQRQAAGVQPAKSLDDDTMERLWNLHADLNRYQQAENAAKSAGSDTSSLFRQGAAYAAEGIGHAAAAAVTGGNPLANMALRGAVAGIKQGIVRRRTANEVNRLLDGPGYQP